MDHLISHLTEHKNFSNKDNSLYLAFLLDFYYE